MAYIVPLRAVTVGDCYVVVSHKLNPDGYFRKNWSGGPEMFHRAVWQEFNGPIPHGFEVHHTCGNRACFNREHLELLECSEHKSLTNAERYADRKERALSHWTETGCSGAALSKFSGVTPSCACRWIRNWSETH